MAAPASTGWPLPTPWEGEKGTGPGAKRPGWPPADWPTHGQLIYAKELITVLLLMLALPWLVSKLVTNPGAVLSGLGQRQVTKAAG
jgi:hypothetical protein